MHRSFSQDGRKSHKKFGWLPELDRLLLAGIKHGGAEKRDAIYKVLRLVPELTRGDCWRRIRYLRNRPEHAEVLSERVTPENNSHPNPRARPTSAEPWTTADDDKLLNLAGYEPVRKIAQRLGRSQRAVRFRLAALGMSAKVTDGWSQRALRKMLRVSPTRLLHFIGSGMLRVRDPRISAASLALFCDRISSSINLANVEEIAQALTNEADAFSWERVASLLGVSQAQVQEWISAGRLRVLDPFVTDRAFEDFCKRYGQELRNCLIDPTISRWLVNEYGVSELITKDEVVTRARKHALIVRVCACGRQIAGNAYFRHVRSCRTGAAAKS